MQIHNVYYDVNISGLKLINQDYNEYYFKDNNIKRLYRSYNIFKTLLHQNKSIRDKTKRLSQREIEQLANISKATFYRYKKLLNTKDWKRIEKDRLNNRHHRPKNLRRSLILDYSNNNNNNNNNKTLLTIVKDIRNKYPTYSKYKIYAILNRDYNISSNINNNINNNINIVSISTIGRIISYLKELRLIKGTNKKSNKDNNKNKLKEKRSRNFNNCYAKPWENDKHNITDKKLNNINKLNIGELIQLDHMVINNLNGIPIRLFNAIDPITKISVSFGYAGANSRNASLFLKEKMLKLFPFKVKSIQVDGGSEFMKYFEEECKNNNIPLYVLPPRSPKLNSMVERFNRIVRDELLSNRELLNTINNRGDFNLILEEFSNHYNNKRPHSSIDYLSPMEYYEREKEKRFLSQTG